MPNHHVAAPQAVKILEDLRGALENLPRTPSDAQNSLIREKIVSVGEALCDFDFIENIDSFSSSQLLLAREIRVGVREESRYLDQIRCVALGGAPQDAAIRMAEFIKSGAGYDFVHSPDKSWKDLPKPVQEKAREILGEYLSGIDKVGILGECVSAIRTERVGTVLNYFLSNQLEADMLRHARLDPKPDLAKFLRERIKKSDMDAFISMSQTNDDGKSKALSTVYVDDISGRNQNESRAGNRVDHFSVVEDENGGKRVVFGNSFSGSEPAKQMRSFVKYYLAIEQATKTPLCGDGSPNPLFGAKLDPFYLHAGLFSSDENPTGGGSKIAKLLNDAVKNGTLRQDNVRSLALLPLMGVGAHCESPRDLSIFFRHNMFVCGADSLHAFLFMKELERDGDDDNSPRRHAKIIGFMAAEINLAVGALVEIVGKNETTTFSRNMVGIVDRFVDKLQVVFPSMINQTTWDGDIAPLLRQTKDIRGAISGTIETEREALEALQSRSTTLLEDGLTETQRRGRKPESFATVEMETHIAFSSAAQARPAISKIINKEKTVEEKAQFLMARLTYQLIAKRENPDLPTLSSGEAVAITVAKSIFQGKAQGISTHIVDACLALGELHAQTKGGGHSIKGVAIEELARKILTDHGLDPAHHGADTRRKVQAHHKTLVGRMRK